MAQKIQQETYLKKGESGTPVIIGTQPQNAPTNKPDVNDVKKIAKKEEEEITTEDVYAKNVFVEDEIEFTTDTGDFGTKAKVRIKELVDKGTEGTAITKENFLGSEHADITIGDFSAYQVGRFVYLHIRFTTTSLAPNEMLFKIKEGYRPKYATVKCEAKGDGSVYGVGYATSGNVTGLTTISSESDTSIYIDTYYEI